MAYNHSQGGHESSWYQQGQGGQSAPPKHPWIGNSSGAEQSYTTTASSLGPVGHGRSWSNGTSVYAPQQGQAPYSRSWSDEGPFRTSQQHLPYQHQHQQPATLEQHVVGGSGSPDTVDGSQVTRAGLYASPLTYANPSHHGAAYPSGGFQISQGDNTVPVAHMPPLTSAAMSGYSDPSYPYNPSVASASASPPIASYAAQPATSSRRGQIDAEYTVPCPYHCGTVLTGVHALGNLTRHLKTQACAGSSRAKVKYPCPIEGCGRQYARSDGMKVHMRRRHGYPPPIPRNDGTIHDEDD